MEVILGVVILIASAILHEIMHGWVADKLGDPTARVMGRLTLNPIPHIDLFMSIIVPTMLIFFHSPIIFGAAKPVPINPANFKDGKKDFAIVALSGPLTNAVLAIIASILGHIFSFSDVLYSFFALVCYYNLILTFINLIPIPPLDGSRVFSYILPRGIASLYNSIEPFGIFLLFFLLVFPLGPLSLDVVLQNVIFSSMRLLGF